MNMDMEKLLLAERAAEWLIRLETATPAERAEFWEWVTQSPLHVKEMIAASVIDAELHRLMRGGSIDVNKYIEKANNVRAIGDRARTDEALPTDDGELVPPPAASGRPRRARWIATAAAMLVVVFAAGALVLHNAAEHRLVTDAGEWRTKLLSDNTIVQAGPRTKIVIEYSNERRLVRILEGEALFHVAKNPDRPFLVETPVATARAVGTAFAVRIDGDKEARVTVKEGVVDVTRLSTALGRRKNVKGAGQAVRLHASEQVDVDAVNALAAKHVDLDVALAWVTGRLIFEHETVEQAVREFNRRNQLQIKVVDQALLQREVRGKFEATDPKAFAAYLEKLGVVSMLDEDSGTLLIAPYPPK